MTQYPGTDPDDPFAKPPNESGGAHAGDETAPITGQPPAAPEESYWERQAQRESGQEGSGQQVPQEANPWAGYGQPAGATPPPPPPPTGPASTPTPYGQPYGQPGYGYVAPPNHPNATTALVLGIISIACCGIAGPFAWWIGGKARREIKASNGQLGGDGVATAGWIMGIIASVLLVVAIVFFVIVLVVGVSGGFSSSSSYSY